MKAPTLWMSKAAGVLAVLLAAVLPHSAMAEGTAQLGLTQELLEWGPGDTTRLIKVDILNAGEVINLAAGGGQRNNTPRNNDQIRFTVLDDMGGVLAVHETTGNGTPGKLDPTDPMNAPIPNPYRFTPSGPGEYYIAVENLNNDLINRLDVTVTANATIDPDPTGASGIIGRVSAQHWQFVSGSFTETDATDADYYILTPGGVPNTDYVWKLDLNNFVGFGYSLRANSRGVDAPDSGFSVPYPDDLNAPDLVQEEFDLYINYPEIAQPEPTQPPNVQGFTFVDDEGIDNSISPNTSPAVQDEGNFTFTTDAAGGTYEIAIDVNGNGLFGDIGDVRLLGSTVAGFNSVPWDGRDNNGDVLPLGSFDARVSVRLGEFHFVAEDAETSGGNQDGLTVFRAQRGGGEIPTNVFWDDVTRLPATAGGTNNLPDGGLSGTAAGYHTWGNFTQGPLGDKQFIDTWVYGLSSTGTTGVTVADNDTPAPRLASIDMTPLLQPGDPITVTLTEPDLEGAGTLTVSVLNVTTGETEQITLTETAPNSGIFTATLATEPGTGVSDNSGTLETAPGDQLSVSYTDTSVPGGGTQTVSDTGDVLGLALTKRGTLDDGGDGQADAGDAIDYAFTVTNLSSIALTNVTVTDPLVTMSGGPIPTLAAGDGDAATFTARYVLTQADIDAGRVENVATATGTAAGYGPVTATSDDPADPTDRDPDGDGVPNDPTVTLLPRTPAVALIKTATLDDGGDGVANVGDRIDYAFTVTNTGNVILTNLTLADPNATVSGGPIATLAPGAVDTTTFTAVHVLTQADIDAGEVVNSATVTGQDPDGTDVSDVSDDGTSVDPGPNDPTVTTLTRTPGVTLVKSGTLDDGGDGQADVGDAIDYSFTVTNTGNTNLTNLQITDPLVTVNGGPLANLAVGASDSTTFTARYVLMQADVDAGRVENTATVNAQAPDGSTVSDVSDDASGTQPGTDDPTVTLLPAAGEITLLKRGTLDDGGDGVAEVGDVIDYTFTVTNSGPVTLSGITITDPLVSVSGGPLATLAPGASDSTTFTARYILTQADIDAGTFQNSATASGQTPDGTTVSDVSDDPQTPGGGPDDPTVTSLPRTPEVTLVKTATLDDGGDGVANIGDRIDYAFTVTNTGNVTLTNLTLVDPNATVSGGPIASLAPGAVDTTTFTAVHILTQADIDAGEVVNSATVTGQGPDGTDVSDISDDGTSVDPGPNDPTVTTLPRTPAVSLVKSGTLDDGGDGQADVGDAINYAFTVTNTGNVTLTNLTLADPNAAVSGGPIASLAPGAVDTMTFTAVHVLTQADIDAGQVVNSATVTGQDPDGTDVSDVSDDGTSVDPGPNDPTVTPIVRNSAVSLVKSGTLDDGGDGQADVGDAIDYAFTVTNTGNTNLTNLQITDPLVTVNGGPLAALAVGASDSTTFTARYVLTQADVDAGRVENTATVNAQAPDGSTVSDVSDDASGTQPGPDDPTVTTIPGRAAISLIKTATLDPGADGIVQVGDTIHYAFTVTNTGSVTLSGITIDDPLVSVSGGPVATLAPGASDSTTFTASYTLTQTDMDAGQVENSATASGTAPDGATVQDVSDDGSGFGPGGDDPTVTDLPQTASLHLIKTAALDDGGDGFADVGDVIDYAFTVRNVGSVTVTNITLSDPLVTVSGGPIPALVPGAEDRMTFTARYVLTQDDLTNGQVVNSATVTGRDPGGSPVTAVSDDPADPAERDPDGDGNPSDPTVTPLTVNSPPVAVNDEDRTPFDTPITLDPRVNDSDPDGDPLTVASVGSGSGGTAVINLDGTVTVTPDPGFLGVITIPYTVCDDRGNCDTAQIDITVEDPIASVSGTVFLDSDLNGDLDGGEPGQPGWTVELLGPDGTVIATTLADAAGGYDFAGVNVRAATGGASSGLFSVRARHPETGVTYRVAENIGLTGGDDRENVDLPVDPIGVVYDSVDRVSVPGTRVVVLGPNGSALPDVCFADASQQDQVTGADGQYYFDIRSGAAPQCPSAPTEYTIALTPPQSYVQGPSSIIPVVPDAVDPPPGTGPFPVVAAFGAPTAGAETTHHMSLVIGAGERSVTRNNLPIDPAMASRLPLLVTKRAGVASASLGGVVPYTVTLTNPDTLPYAGIDLVDLMPTGFSLIPGSLTLDGLSVTEDRDTGGFALRRLTLAPGATRTLRFTAGVGTNARIGDAVNRVVARQSDDGRTLSDTAEATVRVIPTAEFDCAEVIGKVFDDANRNGVQDPGEDGIPGARVATVNGLLLTADEHGRYHLPCADVPNGSIGSNFVLKLDPRTLPTGYRAVSENPRVIRLTRGKMSKANFAVALPRTVTLDLEDHAFLPGRLELAPVTAAQIPTLFAALRTGESTLRLNYHARGDAAIGQARLDALAAHIARGWETQGCCYELSVERRLVTASGPPPVHAPAHIMPPQANHGPALQGFDWEAHR